MFLLLRPLHSADSQKKKKKAILKTRPRTGGGKKGGKLTKTTSMLNDTELNDVKIFKQKVRIATLRTRRFRAISGPSPPHIVVHKAINLTLVV